MTQMLYCKYFAVRFLKYLYFMERLEYLYSFHQNPSVDLYTFFTIVRQIIELLKKTEKRDFLQNVFLRMNFFLKNTVSEILNKFMYDSLDFSEFFF